MKALRIVTSSLLTISLIACSGDLSTLSEGYAYRISHSQASDLVESTLRGHIASDRMLPSSGLVASGYDRALVDTHTYTLSAIPVPELNSYGLKVTHEGTMFNGPTKAKRIYKDIKHRADLLGPRVPLK
jgi:hypothetical protein